MFGKKRGKAPDLEAIAKAIARLTAEVEAANQRYGRVETLNTAEVLEAHRARGGGGEDALVEAASDLAYEARFMHAICFGFSLNCDLMYAHETAPDGGEYEEKKNAARHINAILRAAQLAILNKETRELCVVYAIATRDGKGVYTLEARDTRKRSGAYKTLAELLPLWLAPDIPPASAVDMYYREAGGES